MAHEAAVLSAGEDDSSSPLAQDWLSVLLRNDRMYRHSIMRINYTTYDVRRDEDVIHTGTSHCNVMVLSSDTSTSNGHPFWYARVLGIFHANVIYIGQGNNDYSPRRLEFLWVRWYEVEHHAKHTHELDRVHFPSVAHSDSFGFLDPADVLRSCHVIPLAKMGLKYPVSGVGISALSQDDKDWNAYVINRYEPHLICVVLF